jgi:hypothetical protein
MNEPGFSVALVGCSDGADAPRNAALLDVHWFNRTVLYVTEYSFPGPNLVSGERWRVAFPKELVRQVWTERDAVTVINQLHEIFKVLRVGLINVLEAQPPSGTAASHIAR